MEALGSDKPTLRVLDAGGMARPGVTTRRDETPAASVSGSGFGIGLVSDAASSPDPEAVFVVCHELLGRLNRRAPRQTLLYVDVNGVALVDAKTARCVSRAAFNELTSWCAVDARVFELKQLGVETRKLESRRFEMPKAGVAAELDAAMRSRVRLYVERPDEVRRLRATAAAFRTGDRVRREALARAHGLGGGGGETAIRGEAVASASRDENVPFATFGRKESADWEALRVASATPGERLARAGARRAARGRDHTQLQEGTRDASATESKPGDSPGEKNGKSAFGTFADGAGLDDASLRAAYARREACAKLRGGGRRVGGEEAFEDKGRARARARRRVHVSGETEGGDFHGPPSDRRRAPGSARAARARARARARAAERRAAPPPPLFDATLANPPAPAEAEDPEAWLGGADYFYEDEDEDEDDEDESRRRFIGESYVPVSVSPRSPGAEDSARNLSPGGAAEASADPETARLNRRVRGFAGLLRDSLVCVARARADADVRAECAALVDRLRRFTAEGVAEEEGFAG